MKLIIQQLRSHYVLLLISIVLLFGEAAMCLASPVLLGNLIQTGFVRSGFSDVCPKALSREAAALFEAFLPQAERKAFLSMYAPCPDPGARLGPDYETDRPCYCLRENADEPRAQQLYRNTVFSAILAVRTFEGYETLNYNDLIDRFADNAIHIAANHLSLTEQEKEAFFRQAANAAQPIKAHAADYILPYLYEDAGIDCAARQARYTTGICLRLGVCAALQCLCALLSAYTLSSLSAAAESDLRRRLLARTLRCTREDLRAFPPAFLADALQGGTRQIGVLLHYGLRIMFYCTFVALAGCIYCFCANIWFGLLILAGSAVILGALFAVYKISGPRYYRMQTRYAQYSRTVSANLRQAVTIRANASTDTEKETVRALSGQIRQDERFVSDAVHFAFGLSGLLVNLLTGLFVLLGGQNLSRTNLTIGTLVSAFQIALITVGALMALEAAAVFAPGALKNAREIQSVLSANLCADAFAHNTKTLTEIRAIEFRASCPAPQTAPVSLRAERGETAVLTGATASGKSSLLRALLRQQRLCAGEILVNGENIDTFSASYPDGRVAYCAAEPVLFDGTVRDNMLLYGAPPDERRMRETLQICECDFLGDDPMDVFLENGGENYSGGQRSRLALACALAKEADVYILDDCLSALDAQTRGRILRNLPTRTADAVTLIASQDEDVLSAADKTIQLHVLSAETKQGGDDRG